ncbi:hypothetical protein GCM10022229_03520 [Luteimonas lutimaris]|uniref:Uncharacterized protein n=1 Tax=Luteimonas lutimaris TaxID=698645 RepID=A0ABP7M592_9GAMM
MTGRKETFQISLDADVVAELRYMLSLLDADPLWQKAVVEDVLYRTADAIATGSRRPGSAERVILNMLGLVSERAEHHVYRRAYGPPEAL